MVTAYLCQLSGACSLTGIQVTLSVQMVAHWFLSELLDDMSIIIVYLNGFVSRCKVRETDNYVGAGDALKSQVQSRLQRGPRVRDEAV